MGKVDLNPCLAFAKFHVLFLSSCCLDESNSRPCFSHLLLNACFTGRLIANPSFNVNASSNGGPDHIAAQTFTFRELAAATKNFRGECVLGEGGFGRVYKGRIASTNQVGQVCHPLVFDKRENKSLTARIGFIHAVCSAKFLFLRILLFLDCQRSTISQKMEQVMRFHGFWLI